MDDISENKKDNFTISQYKKYILIMFLIMGGMSIASLFLGINAGDRYISSLKKDALATSVSTDELTVSTDKISE